MARLLTNSEMNTAKTCLRKWYLSYECMLQRDSQSTPLRFGSMFHEGLDLLAQGKSLSDVIVSIALKYEQIPIWADPFEKEVELETIAALLAGYAWRWQDAGFEIIATECDFRIPITNPETGGRTPSFESAGKIDKIIRLPDGRIAVMEHKTTADSIEPTSDYWRKLRMDTQISLYMIAAKEMGHDVETVLYDVIRKPGISPKAISKADYLKIQAEGTYFDRPVAIPSEPRETAEMFGARLFADLQERPDFYYGRMEIPRLHADLDEFRDEIWQIQGTLREAQRKNRAFRNTTACLQMGKCEFFDICSNRLQAPSLTDPPPDGFKRKPKRHTELSLHED
jgi:hypothetical protein